MKRAIWNFDHCDSLVKQSGRYHAPDDSLTIETTYPLDQAVANEIDKMRSAGTRLHGLGSFAGDHLCIPAGVWEQHCSDNPELRSFDHATRTKAMRLFYASHAGQRWRVNPRPRYMQGGIT